MRSNEQGEVDKVKQLQELAIWMTGCEYDFTQHDYYLQNRHLFTDNLSTLTQDKELREAWNNYKIFLKEKYPAEDGQEWNFVCKHHQQIDDLLNSN